MGGRGYMGGMGPGMWVGHLLGMLVLLALVAAVVWLLLRLNRTRVGVVGTPVPTAAPGAAPVAPQPRDALALLDERLARGDIEVSDYETRRRALTGQHVPDANQTRVDPLA